jgi:hypothetical protein
VKYFDHPKSDSTAWVGAIGGLILLLAILALQLVFYRMEAAEVAVKQGSAGSEALELMRTDQLSRLADTRWLDREAGRAALPIEDAMARIATTQGGVAR